MAGWPVFRRQRRGIAVYRKRRLEMLRSLDPAPRLNRFGWPLAVLLIFAVAPGAVAKAQVLQDDRVPGNPSDVSQPQPGQRQADVHNPFSQRYNPMTPGNFDRRNNPGVAVPLPGQVGRGFVPYNPYGYGQYPYGSQYYGGGYSNPYGPYGNNYNYGNAGAPYGYGYNYGGGYGGYRQYGSTTVTVVPGPQYGPNLTPQMPIPRQQRSRPRFEEESSEDNSRDLARRFIKLGDTYFGDQKYRDAIKRYDRAIQAAPRMAEGYFRKGHTRMALKQYDLAADAFRQGLDVQPDWPSNPDNPVRLYGENRLARQAHMSALQDAVRRDQNNPDLLFVFGVELYCGGQVHQAHQALEHASNLTRQAAHIEAFLEATGALVQRDDQQPDEQDVEQPLPRPGRKPRAQPGRRDVEPEVDL